MALPGKSNKISDPRRILHNYDRSAELYKDYVPKHMNLINTDPLLTAGRGYMYIYTVL